jgi:aspartate aminotransferase
MRIAERARRFAFEVGTDILIEAAALEAAGRDIVHLDLGEPDFSTPPNIVAAAEAAIAGGHTHYAPPGGLRAARAAIAEHVRSTRGAEVRPGQVVVTSGSTQGLMLAVMAVVEVGGEVIVPDPGYTIYPSLVELARGVPVTVPLRADRGYRMDAAELRARVSPLTRLIVLNSPNNPTGAILTRQDLEVVAELAERHDLLVLSDEVYGAMVDGDERAPSILSVPGMSERTICVDSFSKTYAMCGWRLGFVVAPPDIAGRLEALMFCGGLCASPFVQHAAIEALTSAASAAAVRRMGAEFRQRREVMVEGLNRIPGFRCHRPDGAFYCFPDIRGTGATDRELARRLLVEGGVAVMPGSLFGAGGAGHLRFSYAASMDRIQEGLRRVERVVRSVASPA